MGTQGSGAEHGTQAGERLLRIATKACETARRLDGASRELSAAVSTGDIDGVLAALDVREPLVEQLRVEHDEIHPLVRLLDERGGELWAGVTEIRQREVKRTLAELDELVTAITLRDAADQTALQAQRVRLGQQLALTSATKAAAAAYSGGTAPGVQVGGGNGAGVAGDQSEPMFQDRVG